MADCIQETGLYIHIPFCKRACFYCHFVKQEYDRELVETYIEALVKEIRLYRSPDCIIDTIYFGGGSPSLLTETQINQIIGAVYGSFNVHSEVEFTIEVNPEDITFAKAASLKKQGINRLSIGTQSFYPDDLVYLKRTHDARQSCSAVENALKAGFTNINVDFIIGLPTQTRETLARSFAFLETVPITHVSAYILEGVEAVENEIEKNSDHENSLCEDYHFTVDLLGKLGYEHYEVSNFSKPGYRARHNMKYWQNKNYLGVGLAASGYIGNRDYKNTDSFTDYFERINAGQFPIEKLPHKDPGKNEPCEMEAAETPPAVRRIVTGLRLLEGIPESCFAAHREPAEFLLENGFLERRGRNLAVKPGKILLLNEILTYFIL